MDSDVLAKVFGLFIENTASLHTLIILVLTVIMQWLNQYYDKMYIDKEIYAWEGETIFFKIIYGELIFNFLSSFFVLFLTAVLGPNSNMEYISYNDYLLYNLVALGVYIIICIVFWVKGKLLKHKIGIFVFAIAEHVFFVDYILRSFREGEKLHIAIEYIVKIIIVFLLQYWACVNKKKIKQPVYVVYTKDGKKYKPTIKPREKKNNIIIKVNKKGKVYKIVEVAKKDIKERVIMLKEIKGESV